jgi:hypothetical protein
MSTAMGMREEWHADDSVEVFVQGRGRTRLGRGRRCEVKSHPSSCKRCVVL